MDVCWQRCNCFRCHVAAPFIHMMPVSNAAMYVYAVHQHALAAARILSSNQRRSNARQCLRTCSLPGSQADWQHDHCRAHGA